MFRSKGCTCKTDPAITSFTFNETLSSIILVNLVTQNAEVSFNIVSIMTIFTESVCFFEPVAIVFWAYCVQVLLTKQTFNTLITKPVVLRNLGKRRVQTHNVNWLVAHFTDDNLIFLLALFANLTALAIWALPRKSLDQVSIERWIVAATVVNLRTYLTLDVVSSVLGYLLVTLHAQISFNFLLLGWFLICFLISFVGYSWPFICWVCFSIRLISATISRFLILIAGIRWAIINKSLTTANSTHNIPSNFFIFGAWFNETADVALVTLGAEINLVTFVSLPWLHNHAIINGSFAVRTLFAICLELLILRLQVRLIHIFQKLIKRTSKFFIFYIYKSFPLNFELLMHHLFTLFWVAIIVILKLECIILPLPQLSWVELLQATIRRVVTITQTSLSYLAIKMERACLSLAL